MEKGIADTSNLFLFLIFIKITKDANSKSKNNSGAFPIASLSNNYFASKNSHGNAMETIIEEEKSGFITKHNLAIPPDKIISQNDSLYTTSPINHFANHRNSKTNSRSNCFYKSII